MKRFLDVAVALSSLVVFAPLFLVIGLLLYLQDRHSPLYVAVRVGRNGRKFRMLKFRSMLPNADSNHIDSTANGDPRITAIGRVIRALKIDELPQFWNVLIGDMSLVGPRPNIDREVKLYTSAERNLLSIQPGITDIASIVFSDLGAVLEGSEDANLTYNQLIRPYKSRLGLLYIDHANTLLDVNLIIITLINAFNRRSALNRLNKIVKRLGAPAELVELASRKSILRPAAPPGAISVVSARSLSTDI
jgi:lipopolysaccharide/colanic/teichoic acid biosynthesis glycosyltransferase